MKKKIFIIILIVFVLIFSLLIILFLKGKKFDNEVKVYDVYEKINEKLDNKDSFLIYFRSDNEALCTECYAGDPIVDFYEEVFNLNVMRFDTSHTEEFNDILNKYQLEESAIINPAVMLVKDGVWKEIINHFHDGVLLKEKLVEHGFINEKYAKIEIEINDDKIFDEILNKPEKNLIVVSSGKSRQVKKLLYDISVNDSYFQFYIIVKGMINNYESFINLWELSGDEMSTTTLLVVQDGKILDGISSLKREELKKFLVKNKIIEK